MSVIPDSVDSFWAEIDRQLSEVSQEVNLERDDFYSQPDWDVFQLHYAGLKGYRLLPGSLYLMAPVLFQHCSECPIMAACTTLSILLSAVRR